MPILFTHELLRFPWFTKHYEEARPSFRKHVMNLFLFLPKKGRPSLSSAFFGKLHLWRGGGFPKEASVLREAPEENLFLFLREGTSSLPSEMEHAISELLTLCCLMVIFDHHEECYAVFSKA